MGHETEQALLMYMLEYCNLPLEVIRAMDEVFHFANNKERLLNEYPRDFVNGILLMPLSEDVYGFPYQLFDLESSKSSNEYDHFLNDFFYFSSLTNRGELDEARQLLEKITSYGIYHPNMYAEISKFHLLNGNTEEADKALNSIRSEHSDDIPIHCMRGEISIEKGNYQQALSSFKRVLKLNPDFNWAIVGMIETYYRMEDYPSAYEKLRDAIKNNRYDGRALELEEKIIPKLLALLQQKVADGTADDDEFLRMCGLMMDQDMAEDSIKLLNSRTFENARREALRNFYIGESSLDLEEYTQAIEYFKKSRKIIRETLPFSTDEEDKEKKQGIFCHGVLLESTAWEHLNNLEKSLTVINDGISEFPEDAILVCRKSEILYEMKHYEEAAHYASESINLDGSFHVPYRIRGNAYYELGMYSEAFDSCQQAIDIFEADLQAHFCQINILIEVGEFDDALQHIDEIEREVTGTELIFLRGKAYEAQKKYASAIKEYKKSIKMLNDKNREIIPIAEVQDGSILYFRLHTALSAVGKLEEAEVILSKGLVEFPYSSDLLCILADNYIGQATVDRINMTKAQECYDKIIEKEGKTSSYIAVSAENLMALNRFDEAQNLLNIMETEGHDPMITEILKGTMAMHLDNLDYAIECYENALSMQENGEAENPYIYRDLSMIYMRKKEYEKAEYYIMKNCQLFGEIRDYGYRLEMLRIQGKYSQVYALGEELLEEVLGLDGDTESMTGELLEEMVGAAIDEGNQEKLQKYLQYIPDGDRKEFIKGRFAMFNVNLENAQEYLDGLFENDNLSKDNEDLVVISNRMLTCAKVLMALGHKIPARIFANAVIKKLQPDNFEISGRDCLISFTHQAEALAILGKFEKAEALMQKALSMRRCDFCKFSGCLDAWIALAYIYALCGKREKMEWAVSKGHEIVNFDYDLDNQRIFFTENSNKKGLFGGLLKK